MAQVGHAVFEDLHLGEEPRRFRIQALCIRGGVQAPVHASEKLQAQLRLKLADRLADGGLCHVEDSRGLRDALCLEDRPEHLEEAKVETLHSDRLWRTDALVHSVIRQSVQATRTR